MKTKIFLFLGATLFFSNIYADVSMDIHFRFCASQRTYNTSPSLQLLVLRGNGYWASQPPILNRFIDQTLTLRGKSVGAMGTINFYNNTCQITYAIGGGDTRNKVRDQVGCTGNTWRMRNSNSFVFICENVPECAGKCEA